MSGTAIIVERAQLYQRRPRAGAAWQWSYVYVVDGQRCQYGPGLSSLRSMLRRKFPGREIIESWKAAAA